MMAAQVLPFPLARRCDLIVSQANRYTDLPAKGAESNLAHQLRIQRDTLIRKGVEAERVDREITALEGAIRAQVWRLVMTPERR